MKDTLSIQEITLVLKKRLGLIVSLTIGLIVIVAIISYYVLAPTYQSSSQFIVIQQQNQNIQFTLTEIETNLELMNTYNEIIMSPFILEKVIDEMKLTLSTEELEKQVEVISEENSQVVTVSAIAGSPEQAAELANVVVEQFRATIPSVLNLEDVFVLSTAKIAKEPITPRPILNMVIAAIIGVATGIGLALILEFMNTKVRVETDLEELGIIVLGVIPTIDKKNQKKSESTDYVLEKEERSIED